MAAHCMPEQQLRLQPVIYFGEDSWREMIARGSDFVSPSLSRHDVVNIQYYPIYVRDDRMAKGVLQTHRNVLNNASLGVRWDSPLFISRTPAYQPGSLFWVAFVVAGLIEIHGLRRIVQHDNELRHQLGYLCPFCHEPLYESRASTWANGLCPKCRKSVVCISPREAFRPQIMAKRSTCR